MILKGFQTYLYKPFQKGNCEMNKKIVTPLLTSMLVISLALSATGCNSTQMPSSEDVSSSGSSNVSSMSESSSTSSNVSQEDTFKPEKMEEIELSIDSSKMTIEFSEDIQNAFESIVEDVGKRFDSETETLTASRMLDINMTDDYNAIILAAYKSVIQSEEGSYGKMYLVNIEVNRVDVDSKWGIVECYMNAEVRDALYDLVRNEEGRIEIRKTNPPTDASASSSDITEESNGSSASTLSESK